MFILRRREVTGNFRSTFWFQLSGQCAVAGEATHAAAKGLRCRITSGKAPGTELREEATRLEVPMAGTSTELVETKKENESR